MDRRVKYTRTVLNTSLLKFLEQKDISKITVKELCSDADVNRSTYYAHFTDPFDQLLQLKTELLAGVVEYAEKLDIEELSAQQHQYRVLKSVLNYMDTKRSIFQILLTRTSNLNLQHEILQILGEKIFRLDHSHSTSPDERNYLMLYITNGCYGMFLDWLMSEHPISSDRLARMMAVYTCRLFV